MYYPPHSFSPVRLLQPFNAPLVIPYNNTPFIRPEEGKPDSSFIQPSQQSFNSGGYSFISPAIVPSSRKQPGHKKTVSSLTGKSGGAVSESFNEGLKRANYTPAKNLDTKQDSNFKSKTEQKPPESGCKNEAKELEICQSELSELRKLIPQVESLLRENEALRREGQRADDLGAMIERVDLFLREANKIVEIPAQYQSKKESLLEKAAKMMNASDSANLNGMKNSGKKLNDIQQICKRIQELRRRKALLEMETGKGPIYQDSCAIISSNKASLANKEIEALKLLGEKLGELADVTTQERELRTQIIEKADELFSRNLQLEKMIQDQQRDLRELRDQRDRGLSALTRIEDYKALNISYIEERTELLKSNEELSALAQDLNEKLEFLLEENGLLRDQLANKEREIDEVMRLNSMHAREEKERDIQSLREQLKEQKLLVEKVSHDNKALQNECDQKESRIRMWEEHNELLTQEMSDIRNAFEEYKQSRTLEELSADAQSMEDIGQDRPGEKNELIDQMAKMAKTNTKLSHEISELREREIGYIDRISALERLLTYGNRRPE